MFVSSARLQLCSADDPALPVGSDQMRSDGEVAWNGNGMAENSEDATSPFYPSVAQRIAVWRNLTTETSHHTDELDPSSSNGAFDSFPDMAVNGHSDQPIPDGNNQTVIDRLMAELNTSRKGNKQLAMKLASVEREVQQIEIEQRLREDKMEAMIASRVADALNAITTDQSLPSPERTNIASNSLSVDSSRLRDIDNVDMENWQSVLSYIREHGCQLPICGPPNQVDVRPPVKPSTRDVGTDAKKYEDEKDAEEGPDHVTFALSNANRELLIENAKLQDQLDEMESKFRTMEDESNRLRVKLENFKNHNKPTLEEENARLNSDLDKLRGRYEQAEAKWEREVYELRSKFQSVDEENFRLTDELKTLQRQLTHQELDTGQQEEFTMISEHAKVLSEENGKLLAKNEELKRLVTVLRRKLSAVTAGASPSTSK